MRINKKTQYKKVHRDNILDNTIVKNSLTIPIVEALTSTSGNNGDVALNKDDGIFYGYNNGWAPLTNNSALETQVANDLTLLKYNVLILKHSRNGIRIATAMITSAATEQVKQLTKTSWTEGIVDWTFTALEDNPAFEIIVRWKRSWYDVEFDHELSTMESTMDINNTPIEDVGGLWVQDQQQFDDNNDPILDPVGNPVYSWKLDNPIVESRFMANGGDLYTQLSSTVVPRALDGTIPLSVDLSDTNNIPPEFFTNNPTYNPGLQTESQAQSWKHPATSGRTQYKPPAGPPELVGGSPSAAPTYFVDLDPGTTNFRSPELLDEAKNKKIVHIDRQESFESDTQFFSRLFGATASNFIYDVPIRTSVYVHTPLGVLDPDTLDQRFIGFAASCGLTRNANRSVESSTVPAGTSLAVKHGRIVIGGEIAYGGELNPPSLPQNIYSLWADPRITVNDEIMVSLPSNVIHSGSIVDIINYGNPSRPHARFPINDSVREYESPTDPKCIYLNYVKVESQSVLKGVGGSDSPGSAVWFFWRPGYSIWCFGATKNSNTDIVEPYLDGYDPGLVYNYDARALEWVVLQQLGNMPGSWSDNAFVDYYSRNSTPSEGVRPSTYLQEVDDVIVNYLPDVAGSPVDPITLFVGKSRYDLSDPSIPNDRAVFIALNGATPSDLNAALPVLPPTIKPTYINALNANIVINTATSLEFAELVPTKIKSNILTHNSDDSNFLDLSSLESLGRFKYGDLKYKSFATDGTLKSLFPPTWYLQTSQSWSPEIRSLTQRVEFIEQYLNEYVEISIQATLQSIEKLGLINELVAKKIIFLENDIKIRYDQLIAYIEDAVGSLVSLINLTTKAATDLVVAGAGPGGTEAFLSYFIANVPSLISCIPVVGSLAGAVTSTITNITTAEYRNTVLAESASRLLSRASRLLQDGDYDNGMAYAMFGTIAAAPFVNAFTRETTGDKLLTTNVNGFIISDANAVLEPQILPSYITVENAQPADFTIIQDSLPDIDALTAANIDLLNEIRAIELAEGYTPPYDDTVPMYL